MAELEEEASRQLSDGILVKPNVAAEVITDGTFFILGEARAPGQYPYVPNMTVLTAVSMAGGFTFRAETDAVSITRLVDGQMSEFRADPLDFVAPGDVVNVHQRFFSAAAIRPWGPYSPAFRPPLSPPGLAGGPNLCR